MLHRPSHCHSVHKRPVFYTIAVFACISAVLCTDVPALLTQGGCRVDRGCGDLFGQVVFQGFVGTQPRLLLFPRHVAALVFGFHKIIKLALYGQIPQ